MTGRVTSHVSISLDGFIAGPNQTRDDPIGEGGLKLHQWHFDADQPGHEVDAPFRDHLVRPEIVLTHYEHEPFEMEGGTTFHFVTGGIDAALTRAHELAGEKDVDIAGGASAVRQTMAAGRLDELQLDVVPVLLGSGERIFDGTFDVALEPVETVHSPYATHIHYRIG